ncbi:MAG TPA: hypothetical protein VFF31_20430 [Blastocatellia bacterium]|nr:hypothetical protein [Blastocatellia bacterium]
MEQRIRIEIMGKDDFWERAFHVEWEYQFPDRKLASDGAGRFFAPGNWLGDLEGVGRETFCTIVRAPENPRRREWMSSLMPRRIE